MQANKCIDVNFSANNLRASSRLKWWTHKNLYDFKYDIAKLDEKNNFLACTCSN